MSQDNNTLIKKLSEGDESVLEEIVSQNMGLVKSIAIRFCGRGTDYEDLVQIGSIGLLRAARSFDFSFGCMFSTYAVPLIIGEIRRFLRDDGLIKVSRTTKQTAGALMRERESFIFEHQREPSVSELAERCQMSVEEVVYALDAAGPIRSLSESVGSEGDGASLEYFIADKDDLLEKLTDSIALREAISTLSVRQQEIVDLRYFKEMSQQQTGDALGITQVKVSREEKKIMEILRKAL
ncbi:MAG: sigma-70 family RNA polymerase sigma factor [Ruminococcaceae bacterium]|nr:sigma-70 family RNA polymerase sigma factor [Oscillospiraceae bacterium]